MNKEKKQVDIRDYYKTLGRTEKGKFLKYLTENYDLNYSTLSAKLGGRRKLKKIECAVIQSTIELGVWNR